MEQIQRTSFILNALKGIYKPYIFELNFSLGFFFFFKQVSTLAQPHRTAEIALSVTLNLITTHSAEVLL